MPDNELQYKSKEYKLSQPDSRSGIPYGWQEGYGGDYIDAYFDLRKLAEELNAIVAASTPGSILILSVNGTSDRESIDLTPIEYVLETPEESEQRRAKKAEQELKSKQVQLQRAEAEYLRLKAEVDSVTTAAAATPAPIEGTQYLFTCFIGPGWENIDVYLPEELQHLNTLHARVTFSMTPGGVADYERGLHMVCGDRKAGFRFKFKDIPEEGAQLNGVAICPE